MRIITVIILAFLLSGCSKPLAWVGLVYKSEYEQLDKKYKDLEGKYNALSANAKTGEAVKKNGATLCSLLSSKSEQCKK